MALATSMKLLRALRTIAYLRPVQIYGRLWFRFWRPRILWRPTPSLRKRNGAWHRFEARRSCMTGVSTFEFMVEPGDIVTAEDWNSTHKAKLWLYNLHYFDDLNAVGSAGREGWHRELISRWIAENPMGIGNGWEPYPTSLRIVNWTKWILSNHSFDSDWLDSLAAQARWLYKRIEWHLLGNHVLVNAKALVFAGLLFEGAESRKWLARGLSILDRELQQQILEDGAHFELSPMYHALVLEDILDLVNACEVWTDTIAAEKVLAWRRVASRMLAWAQDMTHPDGELSFFNDSTLGVALPIAELVSYASSVSIHAQSEDRGPQHKLMPDSGFVRLQNDQVTAILDVGRIGPDYLPAHAHADTLAFELSLFGKRVFINSGTSLYEAGDERSRQRGTAAHNTVAVDGENSSEMWGAFRVGRRAEPRLLQMESSSGQVVVQCSHDGYRFLPGRPIHERTWILKQRTFSIRDRIIGRFASAVARLHVHPEIEVLDCRKLILPDGREATWEVSGGSVRIVDSTWHPGLGVFIKNKCIEVEFLGSNCGFSMRW